MFTVSLKNRIIVGRVWPQRNVPGAGLRSILAVCPSLSVVSTYIVQYADTTGT